MRAGHAPAGPGEAVILRPAGAGDRRVLERLAGLDCAPVPAGEILLAVVDGEARAAIAIADRRVVADPFRPTAHLVELLLLRCGQLRPPGRGRRGLALSLGRSKASALGLARTPLGDADSALAGAPARPEAPAPRAPVLPSASPAATGARR